jgi:hypothetical protein
MARLRFTGRPRLPCTFQPPGPRGHFNFALAIRTGCWTTYGHLDEIFPPVSTRSAPDRYRAKLESPSSSKSTSNGSHAQIFLIPPPGFGLHLRNLGGKQRFLARGTRRTIRPQTARRQRARNRKPRRPYPFFLATIVESQGVSLINCVASDPKEFFDLSL